MKKQSFFNDSRVATFKLKTAHKEMKKYFKFELTGLALYEKDTPQFKSLIQMKKDHIHGALDLAIATGIFTYEEFQEIKKSINV